MLGSASQWLAGLPAPVTFAAGVALLLAGGHWLVNASVRIARGLGISTLLVGLTVVAFGTSSPELVFNIIATRAGHGDLSFGNIVGSNIANLSLVLGGAAAISAIVVHSRVIRLELPVLIAATVLTPALAALPLLGAVAGNGPGFSRPAALIMLAAFAGVFLMWYRLGTADRADPLGAEMKEEATNLRPRSLPAAVVLCVVGLATLIGGGKLTETGAVGIATWLGLSQDVIGLTIVALATSLPEVVTSLIAAARGHGDLAVGNVVGSNLFNILLVLGITALIGPVPVPAPWGWGDLAVMVALTLLLLPIAITHESRITRWEGAFLLACYGGYVAWTVVR